MPVPTLVMESNTDANPVVTKHQAVMYCCKYCSKHKRRMGHSSALFEVLGDMEKKDAAGWSKFKDAYEEAKLGGKLHRAFMAEIGEEMCQAEVAHHANRSPEYLCSRPEKHVALFKKTLAINIAKPQKAVQSREASEGATATAAVGQADWSESQGFTMQRSDVDLYENRTCYYFWPEDTAISDRLPVRATPEEQVAAASLWEFFRLVRFHGGKHPYLEWQPHNNLPIVIISPEVRLTEGADFAFGARWALMQHHPWHKRTHFMNMSEEDVKKTFREWRLSAECPWYVKEKYLEDNGRRAGGGAGPIGASEKQDKESKLLSKEAYRARLSELLAAEDFAGAALLKSLHEHLGFDASEQEDDEVEAEQSSTDAESTQEVECTRVLRMLYKGNMEEVARQDAASQKAKAFNCKHGYYKKTRVTAVAQECASVHPGAGAMNVYEDSSDEEAYTGEQRKARHIQGAIASCQFGPSTAKQNHWRIKRSSSHSRSLSSDRGSSSLVRGSRGSKLLLQLLLPLLLLLLLLMLLKLLLLLSAVCCCFCCCCCCCIPQKLLQLFLLLLLLLLLLSLSGASEAPRIAPEV